MSKTDVSYDSAGAGIPPSASVRRQRVPGIPLAPGLNSRYYTDPRIADLEQQRIFNRTWQLVGHVTDLPVAGSRILGMVGHAEVVVVRTEDGSIRAHVNSCRHRGTRLVWGPAQEKALRCPYHGWTYHLDGTFVGAPENRNIPGLDKSKLSLFSVRAEVFCGLIFVNFDPDAEPLGPQLAGVQTVLARYLGGEMEPVGETRIHTEDVSDDQHQVCNWKLAIDNYLEGYHVPVAHPGLMRLLDYKRYAVDTAEPENIYAMFSSPLRDKPSHNRAERLYQRMVRPMPGLDEDDERVFRYLTIYPNTMIDLYPDHVLIWKMNPHGVNQVGVPYTILRSKDCDLRTRISQKLNFRISAITSHEDNILVNQAQIGLSNTDFDPGPLSLREKAVSWFATRIRADLGDLEQAFDK